MYRLLFALLVVTATAALFPVGSLAEYIHPAQVKVKTEAYEPPEVFFRQGTYKYRVSWQGIPVAKAEISVAEQKKQDSGQIRIITRTKTGSVIDLLYRLRHQSESLFDQASLKPLSFSDHRVENSKERFRKVSFGGDGRITSKLWKNKKLTREISFQSENATLDPISAAFLAKSLSLKVGETFAFDVFNGKHRFLISFYVEALETIKINGAKRKAFKVTPKIRKLTDSKGKEKRFSSAQIWISADKTREILKLESKVWIGKVAATLKDFSPLDPGVTPGGDALPLHARLEQTQEK